MKGASGVARSISDQLQSWDIQGDKTELQSGVTRSIVDELRSWDIQGDQMEGETGVTRSIIEELHSSDIPGDQTEDEGGVALSVIDELILGISKENKWTEQVVLLEVSLMNFILLIWSNRR